MPPKKAHPKSRRVDPQWQGETVAIIGSGPSLTQDDVDHLQGRCRVIVVNDNYQVAPWADLHYACDLKWHKWHATRLANFAGEKYTMDETAAAEYGVRFIEGRAGRGLSTDPGYIHTGGNSGFQALNLAYHLGAAEILLLGFDMKFASNGASHWFGDHPDNIRSNYLPWLQAFSEVAKQDLIHVINCSRDTALECFERAVVTDAI